MCYNGADLNTDPTRSTPVGLAYQIVALVVLVLLAAFFAASEAALVSISRLRARAIAERKVRGARDLERLVDDKNRFLTSILVGNTVVLLAADSLATATAISMGLPSAAVLSTLLMTVVFLLFGEIMPKTIATGDSERWALRLAIPMRYAAYVLTPIAKTFQTATDLMLKLLRIKNAHRAFVTEEDIRALVNVSAEERVIEEQERDLLHSVMEFGDTIVREVMKPRPEMVAVSIADSPRRILDVVIAEGYSKLPVYQESKDDIVGVVHDRELLVALANGSLAHTGVRSLMRTAVHVPETKKIAELAARDAARQVFSGDRRRRVRRHGGSGDDGGSPRGDRRRNSRRARYRRRRSRSPSSPNAKPSSKRGRTSRTLMRSSASNCRPRISKRSAAIRSGSSDAFPTKARRSRPPTTRACASTARAAGGS